MQGVCVCVKLVLVCAASSGAESSWARSHPAQLSRGTLETVPEKGWKSVSLCVYVCEREARDTIRPHVPSV